MFCISALAQGPAVVITQPATSVTGSNATLNGSVNPNGLDTMVWFEWGNSTGYGNQTTQVDIGSGTNPVAVNAVISGLQAGLAYHYQTLAANAGGSAMGVDQEFEAPVIVLNGGSVVTNGLGMSWVDPGASLTGCPLGVANGGVFEVVGVVLKADGTVVSRGSLPSAPVVPAGLYNVAAISAGGGHVLALKTDGTVVGWGANSYGEATGITNSSPGTVMIGGQVLSNVVAVSAGNNFSLAVQNNGVVVGWGFNGFGQAPAFVQVNGKILNNVVDISAGAESALALRSDGTVAAWGRNAELQNNIPSGLANVTSVLSYNGGAVILSVALKDDGSIVSWGTNLFGPVTIDATNVAAIAPGAAITRDGTLVPWSSKFSVPSGVSNVVAIAGGIALKSDGSVVTWMNSNNVPTNVTSLSGYIGVSGTVDTNVAGNYTLTYTTTNFLGAIGSATRTVVVVPPPPTGFSIAAGSAPGQFTLQFTGYSNATYTVLTSADVSLPLTNWTVLGSATLVSNSVFQFTDTSATNLGQRFYCLRRP